MQAFLVCVMLAEAVILIALALPALIFGVVSSVWQGWADSWRGRADQIIHRKRA